MNWWADVIGYRTLCVGQHRHTVRGYAIGLRQWQSYTLSWSPGIAVVRVELGRSFHLDLTVALPDTHATRLLRQLADQFGGCFVEPTPRTYPIILAVLVAAVVGAVVAQVLLAACLGNVGIYNRDRETTLERF